MLAYKILIYSCSLLGNITRLEISMLPDLAVAKLLAAPLRVPWARHLLLVIGFSIAIVLLITSAQGETQVLFQNDTLVVTSAGAFALALFISHNFAFPSYRKTFVMLMIGLGLWCAAEITWAYYVQVLQVEVPFPSAADLFYLSGYFFVGYFLLRIVRRLVSANKRNVLVISTISVSIVASIVNIFILDLVHESFSVTSMTLEELATLALSVAYPILDGLLLIPSMIILYESRGNKGQYFSWIMMSIGMLLLGIGDTGFGYTALKNIEALANEAMWDIIFALSYVFIIGSLLHELTSLRKKEDDPFYNYFNQADNGDYNKNPA